MPKRLLFAGSVVALVLLALPVLPFAPAAPGGPTRTQALELPLLQPEAPPAPRQWTIVAVGDILLHGALQRQAQAHGFESLWEEAIPFFRQATFAYANLEGPTAPGLVGLGRQVEDPGPVFDNRVYTSYPMFNYPPALLDALVQSGIDVVSTANNHSLDRGAEGARRTIDELDARGLAFTGTRPDAQSPRPWYAFTQADGLTVAWLACTYGTNGIPDRQAQVLDCYESREEMLELIRQLHADPDLGAIIVTPHWGAEYASTPSLREKDLGRAFIQAGATAVLGSHPHVPQPLEIHQAPDGREGVIAYSLGNFVSGQFHRLHTRAAPMVRLELAGVPGQRATLVGVEVIPMQMARSQGRLQVRTLPFPGQTPAIRAHLELMFGPPGKVLPVNQD